MFVSNRQYFGKLMKLTFSFGMTLKYSHRCCVHCTLAPSSGHMAVEHFPFKLTLRRFDCFLGVSENASAFRKINGNNIQIHNTILWL